MSYSYYDFGNLDNKSLDEFCAGMGGTLRRLLEELTTEGRKSRSIGWRMLSSQKNLRNGGKTVNMRIERDIMEYNMMWYIWSPAFTVLLGGTTFAFALSKFCQSCAGSATLHLGAVKSLLPRRMPPFCHQFLSLVTLASEIMWAGIKNSPIPSHYHYIYLLFFHW